MVRGKHPMNQYRALIALVLLGLAAPTLAGRLYKHVDSQGNVTYSQTRPSGGDSQEVELKGVQGVSNEQARERLDALNERTKVAREDREFKANYTSESKARDERLKQNCETARQNVRVLQNASRVKADDGSYIDDAQRAERLAKAEQQVEDYCP